MLINLSNHPSQFWSEEQKKAAATYGEIIDLPFPSVEADGDECYISTLAQDCINKIFHISNGHKATIHVMGEMTLTLEIVRQLKALGYTCIASTSKRLVKETSPCHKEVTFRFIRFREYK